MGLQRKKGFSQSINNFGEVWGDPYEMASYRKEDYDTICTGHPTFDAVQMGESSATRGCQYAACFIMVTSGISKHGIDSDKPFPYVHYDIAPSAVEHSDYKFGKPTACCVVSLAAKYLLQK